MYRKLKDTLFSCSMHAKKIVKQFFFSSLIISGEEEKNRLIFFVRNVIKAIIATKIINWETE